MRFIDFLHQPLLEGGQAIKGSSKITQEEVTSIVPDLIEKICSTLNLSKDKVKLVGSAGKKPNPSDLSGDLDIVVECSPDIAEQGMKKLASNERFRAMKGINVFSFAYELKNKFIQVDLMPVDNVKFAVWSYQANIDDLKLGLKGAQRNELFFAVAKYMPQEVLEKDKNNDPISIKRYFYDLSKGLMQGIKTRKNSSGKISKNFTTTDKKVVTNNPEQIAKKMFGKISAGELSSFNGVLKAIRSKNFPYHDQVVNILDLAKKGIKGKGLKIPSEL